MDTKYTVLVVDDEKTNLVRARMLLQDEFNPVLVNSGAQCLKYLQNHLPDLILLDIMMPDMDGFETLAEIKKNDALKGVPVVFLTADTESETVAKAKAAGALELLTKPFKKDELLELVEKHIS